MKNCTTIILFVSLHYLQLTCLTTLRIHLTHCKFILANRQVLVVPNSLDSQVHRRGIVNDANTTRMHLQQTNREHMGNISFDATSNSLRFGSASGEHDDLAGVHDGLHSDGDGHGGNLGEITIKESRVGLDGLVVQALDSGLGGERRPRLVECEVAVGADTAEEQLDAAVALDLLLVALALGDEVRRVGIGDVYVLGGDVDEVEEVLVHECPVALGVILGEADVLVHVEGYDVLEGDHALAVVLDEFLVGFDGSAAGGEADDEGAVFGGLELVDALNDERGRVIRDEFVVVLDDDSHYFLSWMSLLYYLFNV